MRRAIDPGDVWAPDCHRGRYTSGIADCSSSSSFTIWPSKTRSSRPPASEARTVWRHFVCRAAHGPFERRPGARSGVRRDACVRRPRAFVVSVRHGSSRPTSRYARAARRRRDCSSQGPGFVLYALMDFVVDQYFPVVDSAGGCARELEEQIFAEPSEPRHDAADLPSSSGICSSLKRAVSPLIDVCNRLVRFDTV